LRECVDPITQFSDKIPARRVLELTFESNFQAGHSKSLPEDETGFPSTDLLAQKCHNLPALRFGKFGPAGHATTDNAVRDDPKQFS
jgi:hypothetical protein